jgi:hypothetical protein
MKGRGKKVHLNLTEPQTPKLATELETDFVDKFDS